MQSADERNVVAEVCVIAKTLLCVDRERDHCCIEDWIRRNMCSTEILHLHLELLESGPCPCRILAADTANRW